MRFFLVGLLWIGIIGGLGLFERHLATRRHGEMTVSTAPEASPDSEPRLIEILPSFSMADVDTTPMARINGYGVSLVHRSEDAWQVEVPARLGGTFEGFVQLRLREQNPVREQALRVRVLRSGIPEYESTVWARTGALLTWHDYVKGGAHDDVSAGH